MSYAGPFSKTLRLRGKSPRVDQPRVSYPMLLRDNIFSRVKAMPFFSTFKFSTNKSLQIQIENLPFCGVYLMQEIMIPDGDRNVGEVRFQVSVRIGFSVIVQNNDPELAEYKLDAAMQSLTGGLFADDTLYNNSLVKIQGFSSGTRQHIFGAMGKDNETPIAELRFELVCDLGAITYPPYTPDDLETIHVETVFPVGGSAEDVSATQQVKTEYDIETGG